MDISGAASWPLAARAQQGDRVRRIGVLMNLTSDYPEGQGRQQAFVQELQERGWEVGRTVHINTRWAAGVADRYRIYAAEFVAFQPDVLVAATSPAVAALQQATSSIPIVFASVLDPVAAGFLASTAHAARPRRRGDRVNRKEQSMRKLVLVTIFLAWFNTPVFAQKAAIEELNAKWVELFNKGDFDGVASLYTNDAVAFPPGSPMVKGKAAIGAMWKGLAEQASDPKLLTIDVKRLGRFAAREIGTFSLKTKGPSPKELTGKYVVVWEKVRGRWKLAADIWNDGK